MLWRPLPAIFANFPQKSAFFFKANGTIDFCRKKPPIL
jgi:hypothetical protein